MAFIKRAKRYGKRIVKRAVGMAKKRYTTRRGGANLVQMAKDVMMLKSLVNVEKKRVDFNFGGSFLGIGQYNVPGTTGANSADVTPIIVLHEMVCLLNLLVCV